MERNRVFAVEGLDGTGKTTVAKLVAEQTDSHYFYWTDENVLKHLRRYFDSAPPKIRFLYYFASTLETYFRIDNLRRSADVFADRTVLSTIAYHKALGVPDSWIGMIPGFLIRQIDYMIYFTAEDQTRAKRLGERNANVSDEKSFQIGRRVDAIYRTLMPDKTIFVHTDNKTPDQLAQELKQTLYG